MFNSSYLNKFIFLILHLMPLLASADTSICYGTTANGRLEKGVQLPEYGANYVTYSLMAGFLGRTYVHSTVKDIVVNAYAKLKQELPDKVYKYAETGFKEAGQFKPHKTHQNGLSVDFMTPMIDLDGKSTYLPSNLFNRFGYDIEFSKNGKFGNLSIDYESLAAHIVALHKAAKAKDVDLWRVIFDPYLQKPLFKTRHAKYLKKNIKFSNKRSWVRHDEHYHIDFLISCKKLN